MQATWSGLKQIRRKKKCLNLCQLIAVGLRKPRGLDKNRSNDLWLSLTCDLLTGGFHFLPLTGSRSPLTQEEEKDHEISPQLITSVRLLWGTEAEMKAAAAIGRVDRAALTWVLTLSLSCFHVIALKSHMFSRRTGSPSSSDPPISYQTYYFDQKVSSQRLISSQRTDMACSLV